MLIRARAPLRLGLGGGGTDLSPFCDEYGGFVLNATIDLYAYAILETSPDGGVHLTAADLSSKSHALDGEPTGESDPVLLHRAVYRRIIDDFNDGTPLPCKLTTFCDAPPGSGLGSSSAMVVAMVKVFAEALNLPLGDYDIAHLAFEIERQDCGLKGGRQDQYAATFGGFNFMEFSANDRVVVNPLRIKDWVLSELEASIVLFRSQVSRDSANIISEQTDNMRQSARKSLDAMHELKADALGMKECLLKGDFQGFGGYMRKSWEAKKRTASRVTNDHLNSIYEAAIGAGAWAGKISGAGGGGYFTFLVDPRRRVEVVRALAMQDGQVTSCHFTERGTESWRADLVSGALTIREPELA